MAISWLIAYLVLLCYAAMNPPAAVAVPLRDDNVQLVKREVDFEEYPQAHLPQTVWSCDFEGGLCDSTFQVKGYDNFNWAIGQLDAGKFAPESAASGSYFAYLDSQASPVPQPGENAKLRMIPKLTAGEYCLWFKMYTDGIGLDTARVRMYILHDVHSNNPVFEQSGSTGGKWAQRRVDIKMADYDEIWLEGVFGSSPYHSVAVDDIKLTEGRCPHHQWTCDFESSTIDSCKGLHQSYDDDFDWLIISGSTPSSGTGPSAALSGDSYVYMEASSPRQQYDMTRLVLNTGFTLGPRCLSFAFHMYGSGKNASLSVYKYIPGEDPQLLWTAGGRHDDVWLQAQVDVNHELYTQLYIEGTVGSSSSSDIAIDYMFYDHGACPSSDYFCDFEESQYCDGMMNSPYDEAGSSFDWRVNNGSTPTSRTGPEQAASGEWYAYIESSSASMGTFTHLRIVHPFKAGLNCLKFKYHMYGRGLQLLNSSPSRLTVYQSASGELSDMTSVWTMEDEQGIQWHQAQVTIDQQPGAQLIFEGIRGSDSRSDIAIDDIQYTHGACDDVPEVPVSDVTDFYCGFESADSQCHLLINSSNSDMSWSLQWKNTPTGLTGPAGPYEGSWYSYLEASVGAFDQYSTYEIDVNFTPGERCLRFMYHMYGENMGSLLVYQSFNNLRLYDPEFFITGNLSDIWMDAAVDIKHKAGHKIWIMAVRGSGSRSDVAIDKISYRPGNCSTTAADMLPRLSADEWYCGFDSKVESECEGWEEEAVQDDYYFDIISGSTPSSNTGPWAAVSLPNYLYLEASSRSFGKTAVGKITKSFETGTRCLRFSYHMLGSDMGTLNIYYAVNGIRGDPIWSRTGDQGFLWNQGHVDVGQIADGQVWFEAVRGSGSRSDIALDNIHYIPGSCI